jgi:hypothetical protein
VRTIILLLLGAWSAMAENTFEIHAANGETFRIDHRTGQTWVYHRLYGDSNTLPSHIWMEVSEMSLMDQTNLQHRLTTISNAKATRAAVLVELDRAILWASRNKLMGGIYTNSLGITIEVEADAINPFIEELEERKRQVESGALLPDAALSRPSRSARKPKPTTL